MKRISQYLFLLVIIASTSSLAAQTKPATSAKKTDNPKLVIGLVIDQMRWDYLYRYTSKYGANGFKRLVRNGYSCANTHIDYAPTYTACGHTCIYTGSVPAIHGITGNDWFDTNSGKAMYCTQDTTENTVGSPSAAGKMSPRNMLTTTITDELKLATNFKSKTIGIALKDRGAILPAGHSADAAYFYDGATGNWITTTYYMPTLPTWVNVFNDQKLADKYISKNWNTLLPLAQYLESTDDDEYFEAPFSNEEKPVFEHNVNGLKTPTSLNIIRSTPYGNTFTLDFAKATLANEKMGQGNFTDFLAVSLSSTDYIGHQFGINSVEIEDCYIRLDQDLAKFFAYLDSTVGKDNYLLFLTADHGAAHVPDFLKENKIPAGVFPIDTTLKLLSAKLIQKYGAGEWVLSYENMQLTLNNSLLAEKNIDKAAFKNTIITFLSAQPGVVKVLDMHNLPSEIVTPDLKQAIANGYYPTRSGDLYMLLQPGWFEGMTKGTTHGSIYPYDTHIPLVFMGWNITPGEDFTDVHMTDIAPTLAAMLHIQEPNGNIGKVITGIFKK